MQLIGYCLPCIQHTECAYGIAYCERHPYIHIQPDAYRCTHTQSSTCAIRHTHTQSNTCSTPYVTQPDCPKSTKKNYQYLSRPVVPAGIPIGNCHNVRLRFGRTHLRKEKNDGIRTNGASKPWNPHNRACFTTVSKDCEVVHKVDRTNVRETYARFDPKKQRIPSSHKP